MNQFRQLYSKVINDKHDDVMAKFGAILAQGILDAGWYPFKMELELTAWSNHNATYHFSFAIHQEIKPQAFNFTANIYTVKQLSEGQG